MSPLKSLQSCFVAALEQWMRESTLVLVWVWVTALVRASNLSAAGATPAPLPVTGTLCSALVPTVVYALELLLLLLTLLQVKRCLLNQQ